MKRQNGFGVVEIIIVIVVIALIGAVGWLFLNRAQNQASDKTTGNSQQNMAETPKETEQKPTTQIGIGELAAHLPAGWKADDTVCSKDTYACYTKTINDTTYLLGFMYKDVVNVDNDGDENVGMTVNDSINPYDDNSVVKTVTTAKGTTLYIVKSVGMTGEAGRTGEGALVVSSAKPSPTNSVVPYGAYKLGISVKVANRQALGDIDFSAKGVDEIIDDFQVIAESLSL